MFAYFAWFAVKLVCAGWLGWKPKIGVKTAVAGWLQNLFDFVRLHG
jgi:hypothetical protein